MDGFFLNGHCYWCFWRVCSLFFLYFHSAHLCWWLHLEARMWFKLNAHKHKHSSYTFTSRQLGRNERKKEVSQLSLLTWSKSLMVPSFDRKNITSDVFLYPGKRKDLSKPVWHWQSLIWCQESEWKPEQNTHCVTWSEWGWERERERESFELCLCMWLCHTLRQKWEIEFG